MKLTKASLIFLGLFFLSSCASKIEYQGNKDITKKRATTGYVFGTNDIPLLSGLKIIEEESTNFDTISGNIAISSYFSNGDLEKAKDFYMITLPQIGFRLKNDKNNNIFYTRNGDKLEVSFEKDRGELLIKFLMSSN